MNELDVVRLRAAAVQDADRAFKRVVGVAIAKGLTTDERDQLLWYMRQAGWTYEQAGNRLGISRERVGQILRRMADNHPRPC